MGSYMHNDPKLDPQPPILLSVKAFISERTITLLMSMKQFFWDSFVGADAIFRAVLIASMLFESLHLKGLWLI